MLRRVICFVSALIVLLSAAAVYADGFDSVNPDEMFSSNDEYPLGNLIADSYIYAAKSNGITDIDLAIVSFDTIKESIDEGIISVEDIFKTCSLGAGDDVLPDYPLVCGYLSGKEIKLLAELDASYGSKNPSIKMSYSGLRLKYNSYRVPLDKTTDICLYDEFGLLGEREIEDEKLYKVCCNMYAAKMPEMLKGLSKSLYSISLKDAEGNLVEDIYGCQMIGSDGKPVTDRAALRNYLQFLEEIPDVYKDVQGRKTDIKAPDLESRIIHPGLSTWIVIIAIAVGFVGMIHLIKFVIPSAVKRFHRKKQ